jgi:anti-sigma factor RsiW
MMPLLTCKQFLQDLNEYLEDLLEPSMRAELQKHVNECPNCWVVCDTTRKTLKIYKGMEAKALPNSVQSRLMEAIQRRISERGPKPPVV